MIVNFREGYFYMNIYLRGTNNIKGTLFLAFLMLFGLSSVSEGTNWEYFMQNDKGDNYYIDLDSIKYSSSDIVRILKKIEPENSSAYSAMISEIEMDCKDKKIRLLKETLYSKTGEAQTVQKNEKWQSVNTEDIDELLLELVCSLKKPDN